MRRFLLAVCLVCGLASAAAQQPGPTDFAQFVQRYSDEWMRFHTNAASTRRYFSGGEQEAMERQIEPVTRARRAAEVRLIDRGIEGLRKFDRSRLSVSDQRILDIVSWD